MTQSSNRADGAPGAAALSGRGIAQAAGLVVTGFVLSRLLGLVREVVLAHVFGAGRVYDAYVAAARPPETLFLIVAGGALGSAFIPTFAAYLVRGERGEAWRLASAVVNLITLFLVGLAALGAIFARPIVAWTLGQGFDAPTQALTARLMQVMLISPVIFGISGLLMGILNAHQRFLLPALAPALYNLGIIFGAVALAPSLGIFGAAWGAVIGSALHLLVQLPGLIALRPAYAPLLDARHPGVREVLRLMGPRVLGLAIVQVNFWVNIALASGMVEGSVAALQRAWVILLLPQGVIAQSVANAVFPTFAVQAARDDLDALRRTLGQVLRSVLFLSLPASVGLLLLRLPLARLIYERGAFQPQDSQAVAWALLFYSLGLAFHSLLEVVTRAFYALHDTRTPVVVGGGAMLLNVALSLALMRVIGQPGSLERGPFGGLALANTLATTLETLALLILLRARLGGLEGRRLAGAALRSGAASAGMGLALGGLLPWMGRLGVIAGTLGGIAVGGAIYGGLALLLRSEEARLFVRLVSEHVGGGAR